MIATSFSICKDCAHVSYCVLTEQKDKVWSCSDYDNSKNLSNNNQETCQSNHGIIND
jgi:hypothetical protein